MFNKSGISKSAKNIMSESVPTILQNSSLDSVLKEIRKNAKNFDSINYIYVLDSKEDLVGVVSIKEVLQHSPDTLVKQIMQTNIVSARRNTDPEKVAALALLHSIKAIPILHKRKLVGVVTSDSIISTIDQSASEDLLRLAGQTVKSKDISRFFNLSIFENIKTRIGWLIVGLFGGLLAASIVQGFHNEIEEQILLAAFIPTIVYMADAVGSQSQTIFIRNFSINSKISFKNYFSKEMLTSLVIALALGLILFLYSQFVLNTPELAFVIGVSLFFTVIFSTLIGIFLPYIFSKLNFDPAVASGPMSTIIRDLASIIIYFEIAKMFL